MTTGNKRDLAADLAICEAATNYVNMCFGETEVFCDYTDPELPYGFHVAKFMRTKDAEFFVEAREGWPESIRRAMAAEEKWARLRAIVYTNATGGQGEDINEYDIISNLMDDIAEDVNAGE